MRQNIPWIESFILDLAYSINSSTLYQNRKKFFYNLLENSNYKYKRYFDMFMITLIFMSLAIFIKEIKPNYHNQILLIFNNYIISFIFLVEYILRLWVSSDISKIIIEQSEHNEMLNEDFYIFLTLKKIMKIKLRYIYSPKAIIDLLAILPFSHEIKLLRILILFRVFKLFRYAKNIQTFTSIIKAKRFEFITLLVFSSVVVFISSILIYAMEANNNNSPINTLFEAIYWSIVTISTVGYGDMTPITQAGQVVAIFVIITGITVYSFTTSLIVTSFTEKLDEIKDKKLIYDISKLKNFYIICGYENISKELGKKLKKHSKVIIIEKDKDKADRASKDGFMVLNQDPASISSYKNLHIDKYVKAIISLASSDVYNVYTALTIRSFNKKVRLLSILINQSNRSKLKFAGVDELFYEKELVGVVAKEIIGQSVAFETIHAMRINYNAIELQELLMNSRIIENFKKIGELHSRKYRVILLGIYKKSASDFIFNPNDDTPLEIGDYLLIIGNMEFLKSYNIYLHKKS